MNLIQVLLTILPPALLAVFPGLAWLKTDEENPVLENAVRICLWSISLAAVVTLITTALHLPLIVAWTILASVSLVGLVRPGYIQWLRGQWRLGAVAIAASALYVAVSVPFVLVQQGLPTGDAQKAMYFGQEIINTQSLPNYSLVQTLLNRDPVDFYTPGLHAITAAVMDISPYPYLAVGWLAISLSIVLVFVGAGTASLVSKKYSLAAGVTTASLILSNIRFLRYVREPGYHLQNILGEVLLFGIMFLCLSLLRRRQRSDIYLVLLAGAALVTVHQFSAFLAVFMVGALAAVVLIAWHEHILRTIPRVYLGAAAALIVFLGGSLGYMFGLTHKLGDLFTKHPHLTAAVPLWSDYPVLMGEIWFPAAMAGLGFLLWQGLRNKDIRQLAFAGATIVLLSLSQAPRFFIDIPAVRALFYFVVPGSVAAAVLLLAIWEKLRASKQSGIRAAVIAIAAGSLGIPLLSTTIHAFTSSQRLRTNATLTPAVQQLLDGVVTTPNLVSGDAIVADAYNQQSLSWLLMTAKPTFTRLASDIQRPMQEAVQSAARRDLYLRQLDFEKIYDLASLPAAAALLDRYHIRFVTGVSGTSTSLFEHSPLWRPVTVSGNLTLFQRTPVAAPLSSTDAISNWLLAPTTVVNDIGDNEDTFEHLPIALRATRLSEPVFAGNHTYRLTSTPFIPITINVGTYMAAQWLAPGTSTPRYDLSFLLSLISPRSDLALLTPAGHRHSIASNEPLRLSAGELSVDERGLLQLVVENPTQAPVAINAIALGAADSQ